MGKKIIAKNKRASYDYFLEEKFEAGISLVGTEVKSLRAGKVSIAEAWVDIDKNGEAWIQNMTIPHYEFGNINNHQETRKRKLLLNRKEIEKLLHQVKAQKMTIVPTIIYFRGSLVKMEIALGRGKKDFDKRADKAKKDVERKLQQRDYS
ncbi:MAG: SsrA-binding protein [Bacteriovoracaceae bacterium]|jgi:SsrA-binding protein